jgi:bifunctional ADP-heptose synthase (sugar kinase/adenylyltransferase)
VGNDDKRTIKFSSQKIKSYAYKVTPDVSLAGGEYAFIASSGSTSAAGGGGSVVIFDFGID